MGIMEKNMEATIMALGFSCGGLEFRELRA